jgi:hypothetical protein
MRKFAFFIRECAVLYHKFHKPIAAHNLLSMVAKHYQLEDLDEQESAIARRSMSYSDLQLVLIHYYLSPVTFW